MCVQTGAWFLILHRPEKLDGRIDFNAGVSFPKSKMIAFKENTNSVQSPRLHLAAHRVLS